MGPPSVDGLAAALRGGSAHSLKTVRVCRLRPPNAIHICKARLCCAGALAGWPSTPPAPSPRDAFPDRFTEAGVCRGRNRGDAEPPACALSRCAVRPRTTRGWTHGLAERHGASVGRLASLPLGG